MKFIFICLIFIVLGTNQVCSLKYGWEVIEGEISPDDRYLPLLLPVKQQNIDYLESYLLDVSNPVSPNYGKYLSFNQLGMLFFILIIIKSIIILLFYYLLIFLLFIFYFFYFFKTKEK